MELSQEKSYKIQIIRGLAIIAVVFIHNTPPGMMQVWCRPFLNFSVGTFLFFSGLLTDRNQWKPWKRIKKIIIPYIIWTMVYVVLQNFKNPVQIPFIYMKMLVTGQAAAVMYYVFVYCELTLLIPLIDRLARSKYMILGFLVSPLEIIIVRLIPLLMGYKMNQYVSILMSVSFLGWFIYFYLGYLLGNRIFYINIEISKLKIMWIFSTIIQVLEGYWYLILGESNCGTQLKLSAICSGVIFLIIMYEHINSNYFHRMKVLHLLGDCSFGMFFSHLAIMMFLYKIPFYGHINFFPLNGIITIIISCICVLIGHIALGSYSKYFAF